MVYKGECNNVPYFSNELICSLLSDLNACSLITMNDFPSRLNSWYMFPAKEFICAQDISMIACPVLSSKSTTVFSSSAFGIDSLQRTAKPLPMHINTLV